MLKAGDTTNTHLNSRVINAIIGRWTIHSFKRGEKEKKKYICSACLTVCVQVLFDARIRCSRQTAGIYASAWTLVTFCPWNTSLCRLSRYGVRAFKPILQRYGENNKRKVEARGIYPRRDVPPDHLLLDSAPNIGPLISRWELDKFKNYWNKSFRTCKILTLLYQQFSNLLISQRDMSGPRLGSLSKNRWSGGYYWCSVGHSNKTIKHSCLFFLIKRFFLLQNRIAFVLITLTKVSSKETKMIFFFRCRQFKPVTTTGNMPSRDQKFSFD